MGVAYLSFYCQLPISSVGRHKLVFSDQYVEQIFNRNVSEDDQFFKLMLAYQISEKINDIKNNKQDSYEILQNNYINDVLVSLTAIYFFKGNTNKIKTIAELQEKLVEVKGQDYLIPTEKYILKEDPKFDEFILKEIEFVQNRLDVKKEAKKDNNTEWLANDTNNWLKKDSTYKEIYEWVIKKLERG